MINSQKQEAGDGSTNLQTHNLNVYLGIDEKRAREIYHEMNAQLRKEYSQEALAIANTRVGEFEKKLLPKMEQVDGALEAFADPSFQLLLVEAQKTAASTERPEDYDLLSELLVHRFQRGENRNIRAGISLAVGIVDKISDDALLGLTVAHAVSSFNPLSGDIYQGLDVLNDLFGKIFYGVLPTGQDWLDHLDILNTVRVNSFGQLLKVQQYYPQTLHGYIDVGIDKNSENYEKAKKILTDSNLPVNILIDHALNTTYVRIPLSNRKHINEMTLQQTVMHGATVNVVTVKLSEVQKKAIDSVFDLYSQDGNLKQNNINLLMTEWDKRPNLKTLKEWWDNIPQSFNITSVGQVLAHANAQRRDNTLPPLS